jgi:hypothetical protein
MATIITRAGKGSPLTNNEVDANFVNLNADKVEATTLTALEYIGFDTTAGFSVGEGQLAWNAQAGTVDIGLADGVVLQVGQEQHMHVKAAVAVANGKVAYASGAVGNSGQIEVSPFIADGSIDELYVVGIATQDIATNDFGFLTTFGVVRAVQTNGANYSESWVDGDVLYASATAAGGLTKTPPTAPNLAIPVGMVLSSHASNGSLFVRPSARLHLGELHDVDVSSETTGQFLRYDGTKWANAPLSISLGGVLSGSTSTDGSGNVTLTAAHTSDPVVTLTGAVTGSGTMTNLGNVSIATTATSDPTLTLSGDATGSATFTNLGNATLSVTVVNDSHTHSFDNLTSKTSGTGAYATTGSLTAGQGSGSVSMTVNDGYGNANLAFNHSAGVPDTSGSSARITSAVDGTTGSLAFQVGDNTTAGVAAGLSQPLVLTTSGASVAGTLSATNLSGPLAGNATTASAWETARTITLGGVLSGNVSLDGSSNVTLTAAHTSDPVVTLTGAVTGSGTMTNLGNVSIATTATSDPTLTLSGDATGSATFTNLGNATLSVTVVDDSHTHDTRYYTETESDARFVRINTGQTWTSVGGNALSFQSNDTMDTATSDQASLEVYQDTAGADAFMQFHVAGDYAKYFGLHGGVNDFGVGGWSAGAVFERMFHDGYHPNADTLTTARTIALSGAATGTATSFNGSANITIPVTALNASNLNAGTVPDARISGSYTGMANLTGTGNVDFAKFLGNAADLVTAPSYSWTGDTNTGMWQPGADQIGFATNGVSRLNITTTAITSTLAITAPTFTGALSGNATTATTATTATSAGNADTVDSLHASSFFRSDTSNSVDARFASGDGRGVRFWDSDSYKIWMSSATNTTYGGRISGDTNSDYNMYFRMAGGTNRGFVFESAYATKLLAINPAGVNTGLTINAATFNATSTTNGGFQGIDADSATSPSFTWSADLDTGMYRYGANQIGFTTGGAVRLRIGSTVVILAVPLRFADGTEQASAAVGEGQQWYAATTMTKNTSYQNTYGRPIQAIFGIAPGPTNATISVSTNNSTWIAVLTGSYDGSVITETVSAIIPAGHYYKFTGGSGSSAGAQLLR